MNFYTPETFNSDKYKKTSWRVILTKIDDKPRLIVNCATGRKYWTIFSVIPEFEMGLNDPCLKQIKFNLNYYTHPMIDRFIDELNVMLSDLYQTRIELREIESGIKIPNYYSSHNF